MNWSWKYAEGILPTLLAGLRVTVEVTVLSFSLAVALGLTLAVGLISRSRLCHVPCRHFVEMIRRTPMLVQLYLLFFVLPNTGIVLSPLWTGVVALGVNYAAYTSEVFRAGIANVPRGQWEAAKSCNLSVPRVWRYIVLPQAVPPMIPPLANLGISMFKETPILSVIGVLELMNEALRVANSSYRYLEPITLVGLFFLVASVPAAVVSRILERKFPPRAGQS